MNTLEKSVTTLLRSAVTGEVLPLPADFDLEQVVFAVKNHQILSLLYEGAGVCNVQSPFMARLLVAYGEGLRLNERQMGELAKIFREFEAAGIDYMPLKGCRTKALYPKPDLRTMGDADVLIRTEQYDRIVPIMESLGFEFIEETDHELIWKHPYLNMELHKRLIPSFNKDYFSYFGDGWQLAHARNGHYITMKPEDEWIYELTHFAKHFRDGGIGCRHVLDLWLIRKAYPNVDENYIEQELTKLELLDFHRNVVNLTKYWFEDAPADEIVEIMGEFVISSGSWGQIENRVRSITIRDQKRSALGFSGRLVYIRKKLFPPVSLLRKKYAVLQKAPWLLPVVWVIRPFYKVLFERKSLDTQKREMHVLGKDSLQEHHEMLKAMGLDYRF